MEKIKDNAAKKQSPSDAAAERGRKIIEANDKINKTDPDDPKVKEEREQDAERWRNEG